jgi:hypothetical protein
LSLGGDGTYACTLSFFDAIFATFIFHQFIKPFPMPCPPPLPISSWWRLRKRATSTLDRILRNYLVPTKQQEGPARNLAAQLEQTFTQVICRTLLAVTTTGITPAANITVIFAGKNLSRLTVDFSPLCIECWSLPSAALKVRHSLTIFKHVGLNHSTTNHPAL